MTSPSRTRTPVHHSQAGTSVPTVCSPARVLFSEMHEAMCVPRSTSYPVGWRPWCWRAGAVGLAFPRRGRQGTRVASYNPQGFCKFCRGQYCVPHCWHQLPHSSCPKVIKKCQLLMWPTLLSVDGGGANLYWVLALFTSHNQMMGEPWLVNAILHRAA